MPFHLGADISIMANVFEPRSDTLQGLSCRPVEQTDRRRPRFQLARRRVTQGGAANALASDVMQPNNSVQL